MKSLFATILLTTSVGVGSNFQYTLNASSPLIVEWRDIYYAGGEDLLNPTYTTMGAPTAYAYIGIFEEPEDYTDFENINIVKIPYQFSIDFSRIHHLQLQIASEIFYMSPLYSSTYEYHYFLISASSTPSGYYKEPFRYFTNTGYGTYHLRIPTTHESSMATQYFEDVVFMNSFAYLEETSSGGYDFGYNDGYNSGYNDGYNSGYNDGMDYAVSENISYSWLRGLFAGLGDLLSIRLFGDITIGSIALIMLSLTLLPFIIGLVRGKD